MSDKRWGRIEFLIETCIEFWKERNPPLKYGVTLVILAMPAPWALNWLLTISVNQFWPNSPISELVINNSDSWLDVALTIFAFLLGAYLIFHGLRNKSRGVSRVVINGLNSVSESFPEEVVPRYERLSSREQVNLGLLEAGDAEEYLARALTLFNAECLVDIYRRFIFNSGCTKVYLGGLHRIPFLVAYGSQFAATSASIVLYDRYHKENKWFRLNRPNESIELSISAEAMPNSQGEIAITIGLTSEIAIESLPPYLREHVIEIKPNRPTAPNLIKNQQNMLELVELVKSKISDLSKERSVQKIHLFLSVQSAFAIALGMKYQNGLHRNWVVHNYNGAEGNYEWALELSKDELKVYRVSELV